MLISNDSGVITLHGNVLSKDLNDGIYVLPKNLNAIGEEVFALCEGLTSITFPNSLNTVGPGAFFFCKNLTNVTFSDTLTTIEKFAFRKCYSITNITLPNRLTSIGEGAFSECESLTSVTLPNSLTSIGEGAFSECESLEQIIIGADNSEQFDRIKNLLPESLRSKAVPLLDKFQQKLLSEFSVNHRLRNIKATPTDILGSITPYAETDACLKAELAAVPKPDLTQHALINYQMTLNNIYQRHVAAFNIQEYSAKLQKTQQNHFKLFSSKYSNEDVAKFHELLDLLGRISNMLQGNEKIVELSIHEQSLLTQRPSILAIIPPDIQKQIGIGRENNEPSSIEPANPAPGK